MSDKVGEVLETTDGFEWRIINFLDLSEEHHSYCSPYFSRNGTRWYFQIYPKGQRNNGFVDLHLFKNDLIKSTLNIKFYLALKTVNGERYLEKHYRDFNSDSRYFTYPQFIRRCELVKEKQKLLPSGVLTVVCSLKNPQSACKSDSTTKKCFCCKENLGAECISFHEKCIDRPIKCPDCLDVILLQNWLCGHECQKNRTEDVESLSQDFKNVLLDGCNYDLILKVGDKEFSAHQDVLRARSRVFKSMLSHNMKEKNSGIIDVPDCDPQAVEQFLFYVYSGKVESIDQRNMNGLYYIADKYDMKDLKEECSTFIKQSISPANFCEIIQLAVSHNDSGLIDFVTEYFINNMLDILCTVKWQSFMKDNSTTANELLIKSCKRKK